MAGATPVLDDHFRDQCGLFGIYGHPEAARLTYLGLYALQHRGQESAGIVASDGQKLRLEKAMGLVNDVFTDARLEGLVGDKAMGHVRYSTAGDTVTANAQPILIDCHRGQIALGHNGNLVNAAMLRHELEAAGSIFQSTSDTEVILHLYARSHRERLEDAIAASLSKVMGAFSLLFLTNDALVAARDPWGFRPLVIGKLEGATIVASETCALDLIDAEYVRDVEPGELVVIDRKGIRSFRPFPPEPVRQCIFEHVYFARPDSRVHGDVVQYVRHKLGVQLAKEHPIDADFVTPIPDSGLYAAQGYAEESKIKYKMAYVRNHYVGRTFIQPSQDQRSSSVEIKLAVLRDMVKNKRVIVVDDSVIRGTTSRSRIRLLKDAGAKEVHLRVSCPPTKHGCYYGIDFPNSKDLIASNHTIEEIRKHIGVDTLGYLSVEGMLSAVTSPKEHYCTACWTGKYPVPPVDEMDKGKHERNC